MRTTVGSTVFKLLVGSAEKAGLVVYLYLKAEFEAPKDTLAVPRDVHSAWITMPPKVKTNEAACWGCINRVPCVKVNSRSPRVHYLHNRVDSKAMEHVVENMTSILVAFSLLTGGFFEC